MRASPQRRAKRAIHPQRRKFATNPAAFRSGLEETLEQEILRAGLKVFYERFRVPYTIPSKVHKYTPDFALPNGIVIEAKGLFQTADRQKHIMVRGQAPDLDIRFVFSNANAKIAKQSGTTYAMWADKYGFKWAHRHIPPEWLTEKPNLKSLAALAALGFTPS